MESSTSITTAWFTFEMAFSTDVWFVCNRVDPTWQPNTKKLEQNTDHLDARVLVLTGRPKMLTSCSKPAHKVRSQAYPFLSLIDQRFA